MIHVKPFCALSPDELYGILRLRIGAFVVEQKQCYQDLDDIDQNSLHIFHTDADGVIDACLRMYAKDTATVQIGRIVSGNRKKGLGRALIERAEILAKNRFNARSIFVEGRHDALGFYLKCGFTDDRHVYFDKDRFYHELHKDL